MHHLFLWVCGLSYYKHILCSYSCDRMFGLELHANDQCIHCGLCVRDCPEKNISMIDDKIKFGFKCSMCMRCIYNCPTKAISPYISKFIPVKGGYKLDKYL